MWRGASCLRRRRVLRRSPACARLTCGDSVRTRAHGQDLLSRKSMSRVKRVQTRLLGTCGRETSRRLSFLRERLWARDSDGAGPGVPVLVSGEPAGPVPAGTGVSSGICPAWSPSPACLWGGGRTRGLAGGRPAALPVPRHVAAGSAGQWACPRCAAGHFCCGSLLLRCAASLACPGRAEPAERVGAAAPGRRRGHLHGELKSHKRSGWC